MATLLAPTQYCPPHELQLEYLPLPVAGETPSGTVRDIEPVDSSAQSWLTGAQRALIIDFGLNVGGWPEAANIFATYFYDRRTHLGDIYYRKDSLTVQNWTDGQPVGPSYGRQLARAGRAPGRGMPALRSQEYRSLPRAPGENQALGLIQKPRLNMRKYSACMQRRWRNVALH